MRWKLWKKAIIEYFKMDSDFTRTSLGVLLVLSGRLLILVGWKKQGFNFLIRAHRAGVAKWATPAIEGIVKLAYSQKDQGNHWLFGLLQKYVENLNQTEKSSKYFARPEGMLGAIALVIKEASDTEKGILNITYSGYYPVFDRLFDVEKIAKRYYLVLEPSWSGFFDLDILLWTKYTFPVFVQSYEPEDARTVSALSSNLIPLPTAANWWVDHRLFYPVDKQKSFDLVMIAAWASYKRHERFFSALRTLKQRGILLKTLLVGYKIDRSRADIEELAKYYDVSELIEIREGIDYEHMNEQITSAKIGVLWSRREGVNRAIIECMFAGIPSVIREGFNYGYRYPFINEQTGVQFASETTLPDVLQHMVQNYTTYASREWAMTHMTCQLATELISQVIGEYAQKHSEPWEGEVVPKISQLHAQIYWDPSSYERFKPDYEYLKSCVRSQSNLNN